MKYIIMCGGQYNFTTPKQLTIVNKEKLVERTIRLLKENGVKDIAISTTFSDFDYLEVEIIKTNNNFKQYDEDENTNSDRSWLKAFCLINQPCCYLYGDVYYSEEAIKKIINTPTTDILYFCVRDEKDGRPKGINIKGREPLGYKIENYKKFNKGINDMLKMVDDGVFKNAIAPFSWHVYRYFNNLEYVLTDWGKMNNIFDTKGNYIVIDDYSTDIDSTTDIERLELLLKGGVKMVKVEAINNFTLGKFDEIKKSLIRKDEGANLNGSIYIGDTFECDKELADYLLGGNSYNRAFVKIVEYIPDEIKEEPKVEVKPIKKTTLKRKISKK